MAMEMLCRLLIALLLGSAATASVLSTQSADNTTRARREKFGSSLKQFGQRKAHIRTGSQEAIRLETLFVVLDVLVTDAASGFITDLQKDDFIVTEDGKPQQIATFALGAAMCNTCEALPRSIILILDCSGSERAYLEASIDAAKKLVSQLAPTDEMAIVTDSVALVTDFTRDKARLIAALDLLKARSQKSRSRSLQFSALLASLKELVKGEGARSIIIFQTDGDEAPTLRDQAGADNFAWNMPERKYGLADIYKAAAASPATIYSIIPSDRLIGLSPQETLERGRQMLIKMERARLRSDDEYRRYAKKNPLTEAKVKLFTDRFARGQAAAVRIAELTGGWAAFLESPEQAAAVYSRILSDINHRYIIGYYPQEAARDGRWHRVRVEVRNHPDYIVSSRGGYLAPAHMP
jgi:VWFA-related protein